MSVAWDAIRKPLWRTETPPATIEMECRRLVFPSYLADKVFGALTLLTFDRMWVKDGDDSIATSIELMAEVYLSTTGECNVIGTVVSHALDVLPDDWIACDGGTYNRVDYPSLYTVIDNNLVINADTFTTPNLTGNFPKSKSGGESVGDTGGNSSVTIAVSNMPPHRHSKDNYTFNIDVEGPGIPDPLAIGLPTLPGLTGSTGGGNPISIIPPFTVLKYAMVAR